MCIHMYVSCLRAMYVEWIHMYVMMYVTKNKVFRFMYRIHHNASIDNLEIFYVFKLLCVRAIATKLKQQPILKFFSNLKTTY